MVVRTMEITKITFSAYYDFRYYDFIMTFYQARLD